MHKEIKDPPLAPAKALRMMSWVIVCAKAHPMEPKTVERNFDLSCCRAARGYNNFADRRRTKQSHGSDDGLLSSDCTGELCRQMSGVLTIWITPQHSYRCRSFCPR